MSLLGLALKPMLSCLVGARLILIEYLICCNTSAPIDNFAYFLLSSILFVEYNTVKHELSLNPVESIPVNIFLMLESNNNMNEEIILSNNVPFILAANF